MGIEEKPDEHNRRRTWVKAKIGNAEIEAHGALMIIIIGTLVLQGILTWSFWQHMSDSRLQTVALREMVCLFKFDQAERKNYLDWCAQQARFGDTGSGALAAPLITK